MKYCKNQGRLFFYFLVDDFNATVLEVVVPANTGTIVYTFEVGLPQDDIVEGPEFFVIVLMVAGGTISRGCTVVRVQEEQFNGQCEDNYKITLVIFHAARAG